ncbi:MAG: ComF family protein [Senegalia sp. (in: firmicutes)]|uniref:ComF family protein n=1 Tax=Senegalia sp. (in: firmicutes) TaxID=1924098 RepID=UPI003F9BB20E
MSINPIKLEGNWKEGFAIDYHVVKSEYLGEDCYGRAQFETTRTEIGELIYKLKYRSNKKAVYDIIKLISNFLKKWSIDNKVDVVLPVPPSNKEREFQPVFVLAEEIAEFINKPIYLDVLTKKSITQIKDIDVVEKEKTIRETIVMNKSSKRKVNILVVDDLYESGTTLNEICRVLKRDQNINNIYVLTMTKTKG